MCRIVPSECRTSASPTESVKGEMRGHKHLVSGWLCEPQAGSLRKGLVSRLFGGEMDVIAQPRRRSTGLRGRMGCRPDNGYLHHGYFTKIVK